MKKIIPFIAVLLYSVGAYGQSTGALWQNGDLPLIAVLQYSVDAHAQSTGDDAPLVIKKKPGVAVPSSCQQGNGVAQIKATFDKSGRVGGVELISSSGCSEFDEGAISSASRIVFTAAIKDGEPVTVVKTVEYRYRRY